MNDILRIARLRIALQRAFLGRAILRVIVFGESLVGAKHEVKDWLANAELKPIQFSFLYFNIKCQMIS